MTRPWMIVFLGFFVHTWPSLPLPHQRKRQLRSKDFITRCFEAILSLFKLRMKQLDLREGPVAPGVLIYHSVHGRVWFEP